MFYVRPKKGEKQFDIKLQKLHFSMDSLIKDLS